MKQAKARPARLFKRGGVYYYRQKIPADLRERYAPKREVKESLGTDSLKLAKLLVLEKSVKWNREFEQARAAGLQGIPLDALSGLPPEPLPFARVREARQVFEVREIDEDFITKICRTYVRVGLNDDAEWRASPHIERSTYVDVSADARRGELERLRTMLARGDVEPIQDQLDKFLARLGFRITGEPPGYRALLVRFLEALIQEAEALDARDKGRPVDVESVAPLAQTLVTDVGLPAITMDDLVQNWKQNGTRTQKTIDDYTSIASEFQTFLVQRYKITQAVHVKKKHVIAYRQDLFDQKLHFKTVAKRIGAIRTLFKRAIEDELLTDDPCHLVRINAPKNRKKPRVAFTSEDLQSIFTSGHFTPGSRPELHDEGIDFWAPLISLFSGMRIAEICQLRVCDVLCDSTSGWYIHVDDGKDQHLKTSSSRRRVPVHTELMAIGLIEYVAHRKEKGEEWLFDESGENKYKNRSNGFGKRFNRWVRKLLALAPADRSKSFHSFRHAFKHFARQSRLEEEVHDALTGHHSNATQGRGYGGEMYPLPPLVEGMKKYCIPALDLSHHWRRPAEAARRRRRVA